MMRDGAFDFGAGPLQRFCNVFNFICVVRSIEFTVGEWTELQIFHILGIFRASGESTRQPKQGSRLRLILATRRVTSCEYDFVRSYLFRDGELGI